ncbi:MAG: Lrp/AsnC family transcriptional regulator [Nanoarchaeota archaeon]|nr:Lrp/AsnC family transcriptional regulator [Nanoarchaeota archaeon]
MPGIEYRKPYKLDKKDKQIIRALFEDGRLSIAEISKKTQIRRDSVAYRLKKLQKEGVLTGFVPVLNPPSIGLPNISILLLRLKSTTEEEKQKFLKKLVANRYAVHIFGLIGKFDFYVSLVYKNTNHLNEIIKDIRGFIPNLIEDFDVYQVADEPKFEQMKDLV